ncbi:MAG: hypothetical protein IPK85_20240 [Gemmatimonadetes bacterium]|nr:hypothetical protein [Gemmatimonadota bacterium]
MRTIMQMDRSMDRWMKDTRFVADLLAQWSAEAPLPGFGGRLRTDRLGIIGMSFGGATAASFCAADPRCAVGINLDGLNFGAGADTAIPAPFLFATSGGNRRMYDTEFQRASGSAWLINVAGANHLDWTDFGYISPLFVKLGVLGGIPAGRMREIMNTAVLGMMDAHLTGRRRFARHRAYALARGLPPARPPQCPLHRRNLWRAPVPSTRQFTQAPGLRQHPVLEGTGSAIIAVHRPLDPAPDLTQVLREQLQPMMQFPAVRHRDLGVAVCGLPLPAIANGTQQGEQRGRAGENDLAAHPVFHQGRIVL